MDDVYNVAHDHHDQQRIADPVKNVPEIKPHIDGLVQNCSISNVLAVEILQPCTKLSPYHITWWCHDMERLPALLALCAVSTLLVLCDRNPPVISLRKGQWCRISCFLCCQLNEQLSCQWFETPWCFCGDTVLHIMSESNPVKSSSNMCDFSPKYKSNTHTVCPWGWIMWLLLWVQILVYFQHSLQTVSSNIRNNGFHYGDFLVILMV